MPALAPKPNSASRNATDGQNAVERAPRAWRRRCSRRVPPCSTPKHSRMRDRADVRDQQVEEAGAGGSRECVVGGDQEVRRQRHGFPRHHEHVGVVGQQHQRHAGEEQRGTGSRCRPGRRALARRGNSRRRTARSPRAAPPSSIRKNADSASRRRWNGRSGRPSGRTADRGRSPSATNATPARARGDECAERKQHTHRTQAARSDQIPPPRSRATPRSRRRST